MDLMDIADPDVHLASQLKAEFLKTVENNRSSDPYFFDHSNMSRRTLKNISLSYMASLEDAQITELAVDEYKTTTNMSDQFVALTALVQIPGKTRDDVLVDFYDKWEHDYLVVNKCLLLEHPTFDLCNPNKVQSLIGGFCASPVNFHAKDGSAYKFLGEIVLQLEKLNPLGASRMVSPFSRWRRYDETRQVLAKA
ncbi:hypothetical protein MKX01_032156 [Papaver californicum]|nr:hypothetical protein MKX01_032156 [Papaver californicum]